LDTVEVSGRTLHDARQQALAQLGITEDQADIVVLNEGSRGILGIGAEDARVRVSRKAAPAPAPAPRVPDRPRPAEPAPAPAPVVPAPVPFQPPAPAANAEPSTLTVGEVARVAEQVVLELLEAMGIDGRVHLRNVSNRLNQPLDGENPIVVDVVGDDLGILIGRRGETLGALQLVTNLIVGRRTKEWARIVVDVEGYRLRREETLRSLSQRMADRVRYSRTAFTMEAMPPHERRIVHMALKDNPYVTTESHGEGEERRVTLSPRR
jgi:spoIIIJ-associated protein